jgi:hypothetical protein
MQSIADTKQAITLKTPVRRVKREGEWGTNSLPL